MLKPFLMWRSLLMGPTLALLLGVQVFGGADTVDDPPDSGQMVTIGQVVQGTVSTPDTPAVFNFTATAGSTVRIEVFAERRGSQLDSVLTLLDTQGNELGVNDDAEELDTLDSLLVFTIPTNGVYLIEVGDFSDQGGSDFFFELLIQPVGEGGDFERTSPSVGESGDFSLNLGGKF